MGRKKKRILQNSKEGTEYAVNAAHRYVEMRDYCDEFEARYPSLIQKGKIQTTAFEALDCLSADTFVMPDLAPCDANKLDVYLANKERLYLFEYSLQQLDSDVRQVAESLFIERLSWQEVIQKYCISRMTVSRYRKTSLLQFAAVVDEYMEWKARSLFE